MVVVSTLEHLDDWLYKEFTRLTVNVELCILVVALDDVAIMCWS